MWSLLGGGLGGAGLAAAITWLICRRWQAERDDARHERDLSLRLAEAEKQAAATETEALRGRLVTERATLEETIARQGLVVAGLRSEIRQLEEDVRTCVDPGVIRARLHRMLERGPA